MPRVQVSSVNTEDKEYASIGLIDTLQTILGDVGRDLDVLSKACVLLDAGFDIDTNHPFYNETFCEALKPIKAKVFDLIASIRVSLGRLAADAEAFKNENDWRFIYIYEKLGRSLVGEQTSYTEATEHLHEAYRYAVLAVKQMRPEVTQES